MTTADANRANKSLGLNIFFIILTPVKVHLESQESFLGSPATSAQPQESATFSPTFWGLTRLLKVISKIVGTNMSRSVPIWNVKKEKDKHFPFLRDLGIKL